MKKYKYQLRTYSYGTGAITLTAHSCGGPYYQTYEEAKKQLIANVEERIENLQLFLDSVRNWSEEVDLDVDGGGTLQTEAFDRKGKIMWQCGCTYSSEVCEKLDNTYYDIEHRVDNNG